jgi:hypothetical protein
VTLAAGARLGPYEILSPLGASGMGEVYQARDGVALNWFAELRPGWGNEKPK